MMTPVNSPVSNVATTKESAVKTEVAFALAAKSLQAERQQGNAMVRLLDSAKEFGKAIGRGAIFDRKA